MDIQKFEFINYNVDVEIAGHIFSLECTSETGDFIKETANRLRSLSSEIAAGTARPTDALEYGATVIDRLLGEGACDKIFDGRKRRLDDVSDICMFLTNVAVKFQQERAAKKNG